MTLGFLLRWLTFCSSWGHLLLSPRKHFASQVAFQGGSGEKGCPVKSVSPTGGCAVPRTEAVASGPLTLLDLQ